MNCFAKDLALRKYALTERVKCYNIATQLPLAALMCVSLQTFYILFFEQLK